MGQDIQSFEPSELIDLDRYPLDRPGSDDYRRVVASAREALASELIVRLPGFLLVDGAARLAEEAAAAGPRAFVSEKMGNPYGRPADESLPADHPSRILSPTRRRGVGYHDLRGTAMDALYRWAPLRKFVAAVIGAPRLYLHEDPSNALVLQIYQTGDQLAWHFDRAKFSTVMSLQGSEAGGAFECVPGLRADDDERFADVAAVLRGDRARVRSAPPRPGTFTIFDGNLTLHRVAQVDGPTARISLVLSYEEQPGMRLDPATRKLFFGPDAPDVDSAEK